MAAARAIEQFDAIVLTEQGEARAHRELKQLLPDWAEVSQLRSNASVLAEAESILRHYLIRHRLAATWAIKETFNKALVIINPNNPTGAVYSREVLLGMLELARQHNLVVFSDEIYDKILYDDAVHICTASLAPDLLCLTFNGLSKSYRVAGFRSGWIAISGPKQHAQSYIEGIDMLANMRLCANVPSQHAIQTALGGYQSINDLVLPQGRLLEQRNRTWELLNDIPGVSCVKPMGALYAFPRIDPKVCPIHNDEKFVLDLLLSEKLLVVQGTAFNWPWPDHFRVVTLPRLDDLDMAIGRIGNFLKSYRQ